MSFHKPQEIQNLLDLVLPATTADTNIHTFVEFKEWLNTSFHVNNQLNQASHIKKSQKIVKREKVRHAKSLASDHKYGLLGSIDKKMSVNLYGLDKIQEDKDGMENSYVTQSINRSRKNSYNNQDLGFQLPENSLMGNKSAHSSRSFKGYGQINQYELRDRIGKGSFAEVFLAYDTKNEDTKYAIKVLQSKQIKKKFLLKKNSQAIDSQIVEETQQIISMFSKKQSLASLFVRNEVAILKKMNHQYITKLYDVIVDNQNSKVYLVLEYCGGGFINQSKQNRGQYRKLLESECKRYYRQICVAIDYIHNVAKIAHRDIKPQNILLNESDQVKISDFGLGTHKMRGKKQSGTPLFMPPEALANQSQSLSQPGDIWALGVTLIVLLTGKHPDFKEQKINVQCLLNSLKDISQNCKDFIGKCLQADVGKRINAQQLLQHVWLGGMENSIRQSNSYNIEITPADELNIFRNRESELKFPLLNPVKMSYS